MTMTGETYEDGYADRDVCGIWQAHASALLTYGSFRDLPSHFEPSSSAPILFGFPLHCQRLRVFHFEPVGRAAGTIGGVLRFDTIEFGSVVLVASMLMA